MSFTKFSLAAALLRAITEQGYSQPTPIQNEAIPLILQGHDLLATAQTGTGKTASFTLPLLELLLQKSAKTGYKYVRCLILAPTRELAAQVEQSVRTYGKYLSLRAAVVYGGVAISPQITKLRQGVDVLVATPGRLLDLIGQRAVNLSHVQILVLDEADRILDMGFIHDLRRIVTFLPAQRQSLLFSATVSPEIQALSDGFLHNPKRVEVARPNATAEGVSQTFYHVDSKRKPALLTSLANENNWEQVLVFTRTKHGADRLSQYLENEGIDVAVIHGDKTQRVRMNALKSFKSGRVRMLIATDIAARGLDIDHLSHVVNFDLPYVPEDYIHRIGRTGRAGKKGEAISFVSVDERKLLRNIERLLQCKITQMSVPGYEPALAATAAPTKTFSQPKTPFPPRKYGGSKKFPKRPQGNRFRRKRP